jgi:hypothetical protein
MRNGSFYDEIDSDRFKAHFVMVKEQGGGALILEGPGKLDTTPTIGLG